MTVRQLAGECFALLCAVMLGLAAGAIWLLPTVFLQRPLPWLALPAGWLLGVAIRQWVHGRTWRAALLAALATVLASAYVRVLMAVTNISAMTDYGLMDTIRTAGPSMLLDFARIGLTTNVIVWAAVGAIIAGITALRAPRTPTRTAN